MTSPESRFVVGCAGQFVLGMTSTYDNEDEAIVACDYGSVGCEVYDRQLDLWIGPTCWEEIEAAKSRRRERP